MFTDYVESVLGEGTRNMVGDEMEFNCPFCSDSRRRFRINLISLKIHCFNCSWGGNAISFVQKYGRLSYNDAYDVVNFYQEYRPLPQDLFEEVFDKLNSIEYVPTKKAIKLPEDFKALSSTTSIRAKPFIKYARKRGLTERQMELHGAGFCPVGEMVMKKMDGQTYTRTLQNRLILQVYDEGEPVYWNARALDNNSKPKSINPAGGLGTINKSDVIFNLNNAKKQGVAVITEGIFDASTLGDVGVALFGKTLSAKQLIKLLEADLERCYVMLDPDATSDALKISQQLSLFMPTYFCLLKDGDPNEIGRKGCLEALKKAERFDNFALAKYKLMS